MFSKDSIDVMERKDFKLGEFDTTVPGCYRNVEFFQFSVGPKHVIYAEVKSDIPVDTAVANSDGSTAYHKSNVTNEIIGPVPTKDNEDMALFLGLYPGDKAKVSFKIWAEKA